MFTHLNVSNPSGNELCPAVEPTVVAAPPALRRRRMALHAPGLTCLLIGLLLTPITITASTGKSAVDKLCGFSPEEWSINLADAAKQRGGAPLQLTYWNLLLAVSMLDLADHTNDAVLRSYAESIVGRFVSADGSIAGFPPTGFEHLQMIPVGQIFVRMHARTRDERFRTGALIVRESMTALPRTTENVFAWRPEQVWLDGLWFALPFYAEYGREFDQPEVFDDIRRQYAAVFRHSRNPKTGLLYHGWDEKRERFWADPITGTSATFWSRAIGWYAMSLVDVLDHVPEEHEARPYLIGLVEDVVKTVVRYQDRESGLWYLVIDQPKMAGNYLESSASAMFAHVVAKGVNRGYLDRRLAPNAISAFAGLIRDKVEVDRQGRWSLIDIVQSAGLGAPPEWPAGSPPPSRGDTAPRGRDGSARYYLNQPVVKDHSWGVGSVIRAGLQVQKLMEETVLQGKELNFTDLRCRFRP